MEEHQHNEPFIEAYWEEALRVLQQEEKKAARKKRVPLLWFGEMVATALVAVFLFATDSELSTAARGLLLNAPSTQAGVVESRIPTADAEFAETNPSSAPISSPTTPAQMPSAPIQETGATASNSSNRSQPQEPSTSRQAERRTDLNTNAENPDVADDQSAKEQERGQNIELDFPAKESAPSMLTNRYFNPHLLAMAPLTTEFKTLSSKQLAPVKLLGKKNRKFNRISSAPTQWQLIAGNAFAPGYGTFKGNQAFNPYLGASLEQRIANKTWLKVSIAGQQISETNRSKSYREVAPAFGFAYTETVISADRLYIATMPVHVVRDLNIRHSLLAGVGVEYIVQTVNTVSSFNVTSFSNTQTGKEKTKGYLAGYKPYFFNASLGYKFRLTRLLSADFVYFYGLNTVRINGDDRNNRLLVSLNYTIK
ncbi:MAG: hypothetical protein RL226_1521 [Bacteroidota bacterium]